MLIKCCRQEASDGEGQARPLTALRAPKMTQRTECWERMEFSNEQGWESGGDLTQVILNREHVFVPEDGEQELRSYMLTSRCVK